MITDKEDIAMKKPYIEPVVEELHISPEKDVLLLSDIDIDIGGLYDTDTDKEADIPGKPLFN